MADPQRDALERALGAQYDIVRLLGRGGMGAVYLGRERALEREVAIKVLPPDLAADAESRERFRREARTAAKLTHPNIVPLYTFGDVEGMLYFVMGYVRGESLGARLGREGTLPPEDVRRILGELADALDYAHRQGVVHRDIKPDNILLDDESGRPMLTDFGVAKARASGATLTEAGAVVGTPYYMSPEQASGARDLDGRSDLYSLGVMGYQMLSGRLPFEGESFRDVIVQHVSQDAPPLRAVAPDVPADLEIAVTRALAKSAEARWQDGSALRGALTGEAEPEEELRGMKRRYNNGAMKGLLYGYLPFGVYVVGGLWARAAGVGFGAGLTWLGVAGIVGSPLLDWLGFTVAVRRGHARAEMKRLYLRPMRWWPFWWPAAWRRRGDVYARLPKALKRARAWRLAGFLMTYTLGLTLMAAFATLRPDLNGPLKWLMNTLLFSHLGGVLTAFIGAAWQTERWGRRQGLDAEACALLGSRPTSDLAFWSRQPYAGLLEPVPGTLTAFEPRTPQDYLHAVGEAAAKLSGPARHIGAEALAAVREVVVAIEGIDAEILVLAVDANPSELAAVAQRLAALGPASEGEPDVRRQMRQLLEGQITLLRELQEQLAAASERRARLLELLRTLWLQLANLRAQAGAEARDADTTGRIRAVLAEIERHRDAADEVRSLSDGS